MCPEANFAEANLQRLDFQAANTCYYMWMPAADCEPNGVECPAGLNGVWVNEVTESQWNEKKQKYVDVVVGYEIPSGDDDILKPGETVQIDAIVGLTITFNGQVGEDDIEFTFDFSKDETDDGDPVDFGARYIGNAFPMNMTIQNIQMGADVNFAEADFQRLDFEAGSACYYAWMPAADCEPNGVECPEGLNGVWVKEITESQWNEKKQKYVDVVVGYELPAGEEGTILAGEGVQIEALDQAAAIVMCPYDL